MDANETELPNFEPPKTLRELARRCREWIPVGTHIGPLWEAGRSAAYKEIGEAIDKLLDTEQAKRDVHFEAAEMMVTSKPSSKEGFRTFTLTPPAGPSVKLRLGPDAAAALYDIVEEFFNE